MWEHHVPRDMQLELDHLQKTGAALSSITGRKPVGTRSDHSLSLLKREGFIYTSDECADHLPYYLRDTDNANEMLNLPFHYAIDDAMFYSFAWLGSGQRGAADHRHGSRVRYVVGGVFSSATISCRWPI